MNLKDIFVLLSNGIEDDINAYKYLGLSKYASLDDCNNAYAKLNYYLLTFYEEMPNLREYYIKMTKNLDIAYNFLSSNKHEIDENLKSEKDINIYDVYRKLCTDKLDSNNYYKYLGVDGSANASKCEFYYQRIKNSIDDFQEKNVPFSDVCNKMRSNLEDAHDSLFGYKNTLKA